VSHLWRKNVKRRFGAQKVKETFYNQTLTSSKQKSELFSETARARIQTKKKLFQKKSTVSEKAQAVSIEIAEMIALQTKSHTLAVSRSSCLLAERLLKQFWVTQPNKKYARFPVK